MVDLPPCPCGCGRRLRHSDAGAVDGYVAATKLVEVLESAYTRLHERADLSREEVDVLLRGVNVANRNRNSWPDHCHGAATRRTPEVRELRRANVMLGSLASEWSILASRPDLLDAGSGPEAGDDGGGEAVDG